MEKKSLNYHESLKAKNVLKLRELLKRLPSFCADYFIGKNDVISSRTKIAYAYDIPYVRIDAISNVEVGIRKMYDVDGPVICEVIVDEKQNFEPKLSSKKLPDGTMVSPEIDDMYPFLDRDEYDKAHNMTMGDCE